MSARRGAARLRLLACWLGWLPAVHGARDGTQAPGSEQSVLKLTAADGEWGGIQVQEEQAAAAAAAQMAA